jgi:hypothetical protein
VTDRPGRSLVSAELGVVGQIIHPVWPSPRSALKYCTCYCSWPDRRLTAATVTRFHLMSDPARREPPRQVWYELDEALALLADLEEPVTRSSPPTNSAPSSLSNIRSAS